jgi:hypothetical protein
VFVRLSMDQWLSYGMEHKVLTYTEHHSVCPLVGIGTPPLPQASVPSPPGPKGGGAHPPAPKGVGECQFRRWRKSLALCLLCGMEHQRTTFNVQFVIGTLLMHIISDISATVNF